jgi:hypothetical protein
LKDEEYDFIPSVLYDQIMKCLPLKQREMSMTPQEIQKDDDEAREKALEWHHACLELSPEEQKQQNEIYNLELAEEMKQFRTRLNSE